MGQWLASVATGVLAAVAAFLVALPDRSPRWALLPLPALAVWLASLGWGCFADLARMGPQALALGNRLEFPPLHHWRRIAAARLDALGPAARRFDQAGARRAPRGLGRGALCSAGLSLFHHLDAALMILLWHGGAMALVIGLGGAVG